MTFRLFPSLAAIASLTLFSCYQLPDPPPGQRLGPDQTITTAEQQRIEEQRRRMREQADLDNRNDDLPPAPGPSGNSGGMRNDVPPTTERKPVYPFAQEVPGKKGFVFSPYNNKVIDVRDMPTGQLVQDPTYPEAEKKFFRVP